MNIQKQYKISCWLGIPSCLGLLVLAFLMVSPSLTSDVAAESTRTVDSASFGVNINSESVVSIAIDKAEVEANVVPTTSGSFTSQDAIITVQTNNLDGYKLTLTTNNGKNDQPELVNVDHEGAITSTTSALTGTDLAKNTWGYSIERGITSSDADTEYKAVVNGGIIATTEKITEVKPETYTISFGAKVGADIPAGKYSTIATVSAVANPIDINNLQNLTYMQDMTSEICANTAGRDGAATVTPGNEITKQLIDVRDGNAYWVAKLADQNCWMTQNLAYDITLDRINNNRINPTNTDIEATWNNSSTYKPTVTKTAPDASVNTDYVATLSWNFGEYVVTDPTDTTKCNTLGNNPLSTCNRLEKYDGTQDRHYLIGNYYQWNAATAGTGGTINNQRASGSICPKGWQLPNTTGTKDFTTLFTSYGFGFTDGSGTSEQNGYDVTLAPFYFTRAGGTNFENGSLSNIGYYSANWSAISGSTGTTSHALLIGGGTAPAGNNGRWVGSSVRCVAR